MKKSPLIVLVLCVAVFVASCSTAAPSATPTSPEAPATETATAAQGPSLTATHAPLFVHPTDSYEMAIATPTAIAVPQESPASYRLKSWTEPDAIDLIHQLDQYARHVDTPGSKMFRGEFVQGQLPVRFELQDALSRFPNSLHTEDYLWHLAFVRAVLGEPGVDEWLMTNVDKALNIDAYSPESLNDLLNPYGFTADDIRPVPNLFGTGQPGWVLNIKTNDAGAFDGGLFLAIQQQAPAAYQLFKLASQWAFVVGASNIGEVDDQNKNGIPEIVLNIGRHGGTNCDANIQIYEWDGTKFYDLSNGHFFLSDCGTDWTYGPDDEKGIPTIILDNYTPLQFSKDQYNWDGKFYQFSGYVDATPLQEWSYRANNDKTSYPDDLALLPALLDSAEALERGSAYPDSLRFRLGVAYAMQSKPQQAIQEMQKLIASPRDPAVTIYALLAKEFLARYKGDADLYSACLAARQLDQSTRKKFQTPDDASAEVAAIQKVYGLSAEEADSRRWNITFPCDLADAFDVVVKTLPADTKDLSAALQKNGVELIYSTTVDINADGQMEWLIVDADEYWSLIALQDGVFRVHQAGSAEQIPETAQVVRWQDIPDPVVILRGKESLDVYTVNKNFELNALLSEWKLKDSRVSDEQSAPEIQLTYQDASPDEYYPDTPWKGYRWDAPSQSLKDDLLDYKLFVEHNPKAAAEIAAQALPLLDHWTKQLKLPLFGNTAPRDYYLAGYAWQLAGDDQKAAQIYWQLWHDHPDSAYALMARAKLEPGKP